MLSSSSPVLLFLSFQRSWGANYCLVGFVLQHLLPWSYDLARYFHDNDGFWHIWCGNFLSSYRWVDNHLVHILSPNIYRNTSEALESFDYITSNGNTYEDLHVISELMYQILSSYCRQQNKVFYIFSIEWASEFCMIGCWSYSAGSISSAPSCLEFIDCGILHILKCFF